EDDKELESHPLAVGSFIPFDEGAEVNRGDVIAQWDPHNIPILAEKSGTIGFRDMIFGVTIKRELDKATGRNAILVIEHKDDLNPQVEVRDASGKIIATYPIPTGAQIVINEGDSI